MFQNPWDQKLHPEVQFDVIKHLNPAMLYSLGMSSPTKDLTKVIPS